MVYQPSYNFYYSWGEAVHIVDEVHYCTYFFLEVSVNPLGVFKPWLCLELLKTIPTSKIKHLEFRSTKLATIFNSMQWHSLKI